VLYDHLAVPVSENQEDLPLYDLAATMAYLGAITRTIRMGPWMYVLPLRHPFMTARLPDGGRTDRGRVGVGYVRTEFDAVGVDYTARGRITDETLKACWRLWTDERPEFHGRCVDFRRSGSARHRPRSPDHRSGSARSRSRHYVVPCGSARRLDPGRAHPRFAGAAGGAVGRLKAGAQRSEALRITIAAGAVTDPRDVAALDADVVRRFEDEDLGVERVIVRPWAPRREGAGAGTVCREAPPLINKSLNRVSPGSRELLGNTFGALSTASNLVS